MRYRRIIPARAGFTRTAPAWWSSVGDHPRSRGVYRSAIDVRGDLRGSSPLARGLRVHHVLVCCSARIIPARAGFTTARPPTSTRTWDHPRSRGVYAKRRPVSAASSGSSPLARGLLEEWPEPVAVKGIIPARAGFTCPPLSWAGDGGGSSPLARGLRGGRGVCCSPRRIIPARAGFTSPRAFRSLKVIQGLV